MVNSPLKECYRAMGFGSVPFSITPDTSLFFQGSQYVSAYNLIYHACLSGVLAVLSGEVGMGKTLLIRRVLHDLPKEVHTAYVLNPLVDSVELMRTIYTEFTGETPAGNCSAAQLHASLVDLVLHGSAQGRRYVIIVDEAQRMSPEALETLRLLSNLETEEFKLIGLILIGQPELERTLGMRAMRPLRERIGVWLRLEPLNRVECAAYVRHRIDRTLERGQFFFTPVALWWLHLCTRGVPRRINLAGERAVLLAYAKGSDRVTLGIAHQACREFEKAWL